MVTMKYFKTPYSNPKGLSSDAISGWAKWAFAHQDFGISVNPIPTRGVDYAHHITACPPGFENLTASLQ